MPVDLFTHQLLTGRQIFSMRVAAVAVKDIQGRLENKCTACGYARSTSQEGMVRTMQAARNAKPGCVDALLRAVDHSLTCDGPVGTRDLLKVSRPMHARCDNSAWKGRRG